jgi:hypothetical protein
LTCNWIGCAGCSAWAKASWLKALAAALLQTQSSEHAVSWTQNDKPAASLAKAHGLAQLAGLHRFAHQNEQAYALIEKAKEATQRWMVGLNTQLTEIAIADGKHTAEPALMEELIGAVENSALLQTDLTLTLGKYAQAKSLVEQATEPVHPFAQILKAAVVAASGDRESAQQMARKAVMRFIKELGGESAQELSELIFDWQPERLVQILFDLDLLTEARNLAQALTARETYRPQPDRLAQPVIPKTGIAGGSHRDSTHCADPRTV